MNYYDKVNGEVGFRESDHVYENLKDPSINYISVTTLIGRYEQPYDKEFWSAYKALEKLLDKESWSIEKKSLLTSRKFDKKLLEVYNISENDFNKTQQDILDFWQEENRKSCERGTKIHAEMENSFYKSGDNVNLSKYGIGGKFVCKKDYSELNLPYGVYPEYLIYYDNFKINLHLAGQIDLLIKEGNELILGDFKTNKELKTKGFYNPYTRKASKMKFPLQGLDDVNFNHYQLQLSTYAWMMQKLNPEFEIKRLFLCHIDHDNNTKIYDCEYLKDNVENMLKHYVKQNKIELQNKKYERIQY